MDYLLSRQVFCAVSELVTGHTHAVNGSYSNWQPITSAIPERPVLSPMLFNIFVSDLDGGIKHTFMKCADDIKLSGEVDTSEGRATLHEVFNWLKEWANTSPVMFKKDKYRVLHLENTIRECRTVWDLPS